MVCGLQRESPRMIDQRTDFESSEARHMERDALRAAASDARERAEQLAARALARGTIVRRQTWTALDGQDDAARLQLDLHSHVSVYARTMRELGEPPERVVVLVRQLADAAAIRAYDDAKTPISDHHDLRDTVVSWAIGSYYDA